MICVLHEWLDGSRQITEARPPERRCARNMSARLFCFPAVESAGEITQATLLTWRAAQSFRHHWFSLRSPAQLPRGIIYGDSAKMAHRAGFSSVPGSSGNSGYGGSPKSSTISISSRASRFACLRGGARRKENPRRRFRNAPSLSFFADVRVPRLEGRLRRSKKTEPTPLR